MKQIFTVLIPLSLILVALVSSASPNSAHVGFSIESSAQPTRLLEVYSSQGCSSCPPAEKWVNSWLKSPDLWTKFIPLVFHVDYWDYLGWPDPFAQATFSARQSEFKRQGLANAVYTPGFMLDGKEWRGWFRGKPVTPFDNKSGKLVVKLDGRDVEASYDQIVEGDRLNIALVGFGFNTYISKGENRRKSLQQEFVVLSHKEVDMLGNRWLTDVDEPSVEAQRYALVAWVTPTDSLRPKQVAGGFVPNQVFNF